MRALLIGCVAGVLAMSLLTACSEAKQDVIPAAEDTAKMLEANVEKSIEIEEETYKKKRAEGEGVVEAAGDAYEAVLQEGNAEATE